MSAPEEFTEDFTTVAGAEAEWIAVRRKAAGDVSADAPLAGLAFSGGGIRSATFNLGVLQALEHSGLLRRFDYLSTVSGGGYTGSWLTWLRSQVPASDGRRLADLPLANGHGTVMDWLRAHGRYLIAGKGLSAWTLAASVLSGTLLNLFVLLPIFLLAIYFMSQDWLAYAWPTELRMPGARAVRAHDGFMLLTVAGLASLALYLVYTLIFALSTVLKPLRRLSAGQSIRLRLGKLLAAGVGLVGIGMLPVLAGVEETALLWLKFDGARELTRHATWIAPLVAGALTLRRASKKGPHGDTLAVLGLVLILLGGFTGLYHLVNHTTLMQSPGFLVWMGLSVLFALVCDINAISMHSYYRRQLAAAFMPEIRKPERMEDEPVAFRVDAARAESGGPLQIVNTTLNTTSSPNPTRRARNGESFFVTPLFCGSTATGYRRTSQWLRGELTLSTAFSVSGAAVDPDMYATKSRPVSFLMALFNIRLGVWVRNPRDEPRRWRIPAWYQLMLREMLGRGLTETGARVHLADGGHFENLGVYELLRRRCRYIVVCDAGADPGCTLADLGQAVQRSRADFGAHIDICADAFFHSDAQALRPSAHLVGRVTYADGSQGEILYLKALLRQHLGADIYGYWRCHPEFPNQSTANQFYGELQFDTYRELGRQLMAGVVGEDSDIEKVFARWRRPNNP